VHRRLEDAEGKPAPGGTCTNVGCIPSKALLQSSENYEHAGHAFAEHGIEVKGLALNLGQMLARKDKVVRQNNDGIVYLFKKNKIAFFNGTGSFAAADGSAGWRIAVSGAGDQTLTRQAHHRRHRIVAARAGRCGIRQSIHSRQRWRAGDGRGSQHAWV
jgi:pyruvate/2-oxoglutarate dehydrogenase complex dihydrolipoamide dehydrogenase (E3) component